MRFVYILRSRDCPDRFYVGSTGDMKHRLSEHNGRKGRHTSKYAPWLCLVSMEFADDSRADAFEKYLKTGSGRAFSNRHFR